MLYRLRHVAVRGWTTIIFGGLASLWILPVIQPLTGLSGVLPSVLVLLGLIYLVVGWLMNRYGLYLVESIVAEAAVWERAGRTRDADSTYQKAAAVFDSFLLSPLAQKRKSAYLVAQLARFYMARADKNHGSEAFIVSYLNAHPEDREVAEHWLPHLKSMPFLPEAYQNLALRIGNSQPDNRVVQEMLARLYLSYARTDFAALQTYRRVFNNGWQTKSDFLMDLAGIFLAEGRSDEWALEIYLKAYQTDQKKTALISGITAGLHWIPENADNKILLARARQVVTGINVNPDDIRTMIAGFNPPVQLPPIEYSSETARPPARNFAASVPHFFQRRAAVLQRGFTKAAGQTSRALLLFLRRIRASRRSQLIIKRGFLGALAAGMLLLLLNTAGYLFKSHPVVEKEKITAVVTTDPFTLQVAAYLKAGHAERYVTYLKKQKLDAYWKMAEGKNKRWYQVRVSHFADKASAVSYGMSLKARGLIEDFYVANYSQP